MVAAGIERSAPAQLGDGQHQQRHADQLQHERPGLLDVAAVRGGGGLLGGHPEAQRGDHLAAARPVEQIERHGEGRNGPEDRQELQKRKIEEVHYAIPRTRMSSPKIRSSMGCEVATPA